MSSFLRSRTRGAGPHSPPLDTDGAEDILAQLSILDGGERDDDNFSLVDGPSLDGGDHGRSGGTAVHGLSRGRNMADTAGARGYGGESSTYSTPVFRNNSRFPQTGGVASQGQGQGTTSRFSHAGASPTYQGEQASVSTALSLDGKSKLLKAIFVDDEFLVGKCCGFVGSSGQFCLRDRIASTGFSSCQTKNHAERRFTPLVESFYAPMGLHYNVPTANSIRTVNINDMSRITQARFAESLFTREGWDREFLEASRTIAGRVDHHSPVPPTGLPEVVETRYQGDTRDDGASLAFMSTHGSVVSSARAYEEGTQFPWEIGVQGDLDMDEGSFDTHRIALHRLREAVGRRFVELKESMRATASQAVVEEMSDVLQLITQHGSMEAAIEEIADAHIRRAHQSFQVSLQNLERRLASNQAGTGSPNLTSIFRRHVEQSARREARLEQRLRALEIDAQQGARVSTIDLAGGGFDRIGPDTEIMVNMGGREVPVSMVMVARKAFELEQKIEVLAARAKHGGVAVGDFNFASESEFQAFMMKHDPAGNGLAAFVDLSSLSRGFGGEDLSTQEFLTTSQQSHRVNLKMGEAAYGASFNIRYPKWLNKSSSSTRVASSTTVDMLKSWANWMGNGHLGDGFKDSITRMIDQACANHKQYVEDAMLPDELRKLALLTAELTRKWWTELCSYLDNEYLMLDNYKLASEQTLLLLSNQTVQMFEDIYETRVPAANTDITQRSTASVRYAWVTLRAHSVMSAYRDVKFRDHPAIAGTFIRFLTRNLADQSSLSLNTTVKELEKEVKRLKGDLEKKLSVAAFNSFETKVTNQLREKK